MRLGLAAPNGQMKRSLTGKTIADQLPPDPDDQSRGGRLTGSGQQTSHDLRFTSRTQAELVSVPGRTLGRRNGSRQGGALVDQLQQL
jgi:hypothetical protein